MIRAVAKANKLELEFVETTPANGVPSEYLKINPLGKVPSFVGADGYTLTECIAIAIYSMYPSHRILEVYPHLPLPHKDETHYQFQLSLSEDTC